MFQTRFDGNIYELRLWGTMNFTIPTPHTQTVPIL